MSAGRRSSSDRLNASRAAASRNRLGELLYYDIIYYNVLHHTIIYHTIMYYAVLHVTILYYNLLYATIIYYTILYYTILYYITNTDRSGGGRTQCVTTCRFRLRGNGLIDGWKINSELMSICVEQTTCRFRWYPSVPETHVPQRRRIEGIVSASIERCPPPWSARGYDGGSRPTGQGACIPLLPCVDFATAWQVRHATCYAAWQYHRLLAWTYRQCETYCPMIQTIRVLLSHRCWQGCWRIARRAP